MQRFLSCVRSMPVRPPVSALSIIAACELRPSSASSRPCYDPTAIPLRPEPPSPRLSRPAPTRLRHSLSLFPHIDEHRDKLDQTSPGAAPSDAVTHGGSGEFLLQSCRLFATTAMTICYIHPRRCRNTCGGGDFFAATVPAFATASDDNCYIHLQ